jgi:GT2 family glycosyltransferase
MRVHVVVPTFRETVLAASFLERWSQSGSKPRLILVNGDPGDATSDLVAAWRDRVEVVEVAGNPDLYWSGLTALGLREVAATADEGDFFLLTNIDVRPEGDPLHAILEGVDGLERRQVTIPVVGGDGRIVSAGVEVRSWCLSLNRHIGDGLSPGDLPARSCLPATYLPTRFLLAPVKALRDGLFPDEIHLPHYCADYEFTNRLRWRGYEPVVFTGAAASLSEENTGFDTYLAPTTLRERLARTRDIKCPYNFRYRFQFVRLTYPAVVFLPGLISHFAKIFLEIAFGGRNLQRWRLR